MEKVVSDLSCPLCLRVGEEVLWEAALCRVVAVAEPDYPGFCRVIWNAHVKEMTDISSHLRNYLMEIVFIVEKTLRQVLNPDKINLASLGNLTPHLHWHIIPRFQEDVHFPMPIWGIPQRQGVPRLHPNINNQLQRILSTQLAALTTP